MINEERLKKLRELRASGGYSATVSNTPNPQQDRLSRLKEQRLKQIESSKPQPIQEEQPQEIKPEEISIWNRIKSFLAPKLNAVSDFVQKNPNPVSYVKEKLFTPQENKRMVFQVGDNVPTKPPYKPVQNENTVQIKEQPSRFEQARRWAVEKIGGMNQLDFETQDAIKREQQTVQDELKSGKISKEEFAKRDIAVNDKYKKELEAIQQKNISGAVGLLDAPVNSLSKKIAKETSEDVIKSLLKGTVKDQESDGLARILKNVSKEEDVAKIISEATAVNPSIMVPEASKLPVGAPNVENGIKTPTPIFSENKTQIIDEGIKNAVKNDEVLKKKADAAVEIVKSDGSVKPAMQNWLRNTFKGKAEAQQEALNFKIKEDAGNLIKHEAGENYAGRDLVEKKFDELYQKADDAGIVFEKKQNYVPHVYNESPDQIRKSVAKAMEEKGVDKDIIEGYLNGDELSAELAKSLKMSPFFTRERAFETYAEAAKYGLTPKYDTMAQLVGHYTGKMNDVIANQKLIDDLVAGHQLTSKPRQGMLAVNLPGNEGAYFAEPKIAGYLNDYFRNEDALNVLQIGAKYGAKLSQGLQNIVLAGGFPKTNLNFFTFGHVIKSLTTSVGNVATLNFRGALTQFKSIANVVRSNFTKPSINWFNKRVENGTMGRMANEGIDMSNVVGNFKENNRGFINFFKKTETKKIFGEGYDKIISEKTFNSFLPMQTTSVFEDAYKTGLRKGMAEAEASKFAGGLTKKFMGFSDALRGKTADNTLSTLFFAPRFREGLINTYWDTLKSVSPHTWLKPEYAQNRKLAIGMVTTFFGGYDYLNKKLNGHHMWENPTGKKTELMIPGKDGKVYYVPFMPSQLAFFRNVVEGGSNLSMGVKLITDILGNKDYFGNEIYDSQAPRLEQLSDVAKYLGQNANHPHVKGVWNLLINANAKSQKIYPTYEKITNLLDQGKREEADLIIGGLSDEDKNAYEEMRKQKLKPTAQVMSEMMEIPIRFTTQGKIDAQKYYQKIDYISRDVKSVPEGEERTKKIQQYIKDTPEEDRRGIVYALGKNGISTKGVSVSENSIRAKELAKQWDSLSRADQLSKAREEIKRDKKFLPILKEALKERNMSQQEIDLKNGTVEERATMIKDKIKGMDTAEKSKYLIDLKKKGILTTAVIQKIKAIP